MAKRIKIEIRKEYKNNFLIKLLIILAISALFFAIINIFILYPLTKKPITYNNFQKNFISMNNITYIVMKVPAVDNEGNGVSTWLSVEAMPGSGRTFIDIDNLLFWADTQQSMRTARLVAGNVSGKDVNKYDLIYNIMANASLIGGPSAGAALTIATIAALENKHLNESVMITGTINHDGSLGPVGGILEKAKASKDVNAVLFLVPLLQSRDILYETYEYCEKFGWADICTTETIPKKIDVEKEANISIKEIGDVREALKYF